MNDRLADLLLTPSKALDEDSLLLHQLGDFFGKNTGLEGYSQIKALIFYRSLISYMIAEKTQDEKQLNTMLKKINQAIDLHDSLMNNINDFQIKLQTHLENLKTEETLFIPGGWIGHPSGHALICEFIKKENNSFSFRIYNTGEGIQNHLIKNHDIKNKIIPFIELSNILVEKILERPFLLALRQFQTLRQFQKIVPQNIAWESKDIYQILMSHLNAQGSMIQYEQEDLMTPQRSGTCSFTSLKAFFYHLNTDKTVSQRIYFDLLSLGIHKYFKNNKNRFSHDSRAQTLFAKSLEEFSRLTTVLYKEKIIDDKKLIKINQQIKEYESKLITGKNTYLKNLEINAVTLDISSIPKNNPLEPLEYRILVSDQEEKIGLFSLPLLKTWITKKETFLQDLSFFLNGLQEGTKQGSHISTFVAIQTLIKKLDFKKISFTKEETTQVINQLHQLSFLYYATICNISLQDPQNHKLVLSPKMLLSINKIMFHAAKLLDVHYPNLSNDLVMDIFNHRELKQSSLFFADPELDEIYDELKEQNRKLFHTQQQEKQLLVRNREKEDIFKQVNYDKLFTMDFNDPSISIFPFISQSNIMQWAQKTGPSISTSQNQEILISFFDRINFYHYEQGEKVYEVARNSRDIFPQEFYQLYDLNLLSYLLEKFPTLNRADPSSSKPILLNDIKIETSFDIEKKDNFRFQLMPFKNNEKSALSPHTFKFKELFQDILNKKKLSYSENQSIVDHPGNNYQGQSIQTFRELYKFTTDKRLLIKETLSYFSANFHLLKKKNINTFLKILSLHRVYCLKN